MQAEIGAKVGSDEKAQGIDDAAIEAGEPGGMTRALVVRASFANPGHWGWMRYLWAIGRQKGTRL